MGSSVISRIKDIRADISPLTDAGTRITENIVENMQRKDLSLYEQARACAQLRTGQKMSLAEAAEKTGLSKPFISNLVVMYEGLPTIVTEAWKAGHEAATFNFLRAMATVDKKTEKTPEAVAERQIRQWTERAEAYTDFSKVLKDSESDGNGDGGDDGTGGKKKKKPKKLKNFKVTPELFAELSAAVKKSKLPGAGFAIQCMRLLVGDLESIKGVFPLTQPTKEKD